MRIRLRWVIFQAILLFSTALTIAAAEPLDALLPVRGFCITAPRPKEVYDFAGFIAKELAPRHVNILVLRVDYNYQYESRPKLRDAEALSRDDVKKLVTVCKTNGIRLIPQLNLLGHQSWATNALNLLRVYPEFDETPGVKFPAKYKWPNEDGLYCKSYCPLHPKVHEVVFSLMDEICDAFEADAFHAGMDEVFYIGHPDCPRCAGKDKAELFAGEVQAIRDHLAAKKRVLWIWGDRLIDGTTTGLGIWEASGNGTHRAIDLIPRDVMICDWHYERPDPTAVLFAMKGLKVVTCPWKNAKSAVAQTRDMIEFRRGSTPKMRENFQGMMHTVWSGAGQLLDRVSKGTNGPPDPQWECFKAWVEEADRLNLKDQNN
jgi:hypothetical protein